jgi:hypothetical protein
MARPALFRLIFSSAKPDYASPELIEAAEVAYVHLVGLVTALGGGEADVIALWATSHGIADLTSGGKMRTLQGKPPAEREALLRAVLRRSLPGAG